MTTIELIYKRYQLIMLANKVEQIKASDGVLENQKQSLLNDIQQSLQSLVNQQATPASDVKLTPATHRQPPSLKVATPADAEFDGDDCGVHSPVNEVESVELVELALNSSLV